MTTQRVSGPVVAVIGGAGFIGRATVAALEAAGARPVVVDHAPGPGVVVVDITAPEAPDTLARVFRGERVDPGRFDGVQGSTTHGLASPSEPGDAARHSRVAGERVDAVVHLAARVDPAAGAAERDAMRRLHVDGTAAVVRAARSAGVARFVLASSAVVYGARAENRVPIDESARVRPNDDFAYAVDKAAQEEIVAAEFPGAAVARPAIVYGAGARNYLTEIIRRAPFLPALDGRRPQLQFVHVDDVASALAFLAHSDLHGAFNVASADWLALEEVARLAHKRVVDVPYRAVAPVVDALARFMPPHLRAPASMLPYLMHPFVVSSSKLSAAGCAPCFTSADAVRAMLARR